MAAVATGVSGERANGLMASVVLKNVVKRFGKVEVVHGISLDIDDRQFVVLVGPSGCGKSTVLRMVAGLEVISSGDVMIGDRLVNGIAPKDRGVAMVFQNYALYPHMSVFENMSFGLKLRKVPKKDIDERVQAAARILGLQDFWRAVPTSSPAASASGSPWGGPSSEIPRFFSSTNPCPTWTPNCAPRCA